MLTKSMGIAGLLIAAALLAAGGCASARPPQPVPSLFPSEEVRASLGRISIPSGMPFPSGEWHRSVKGAAEGARRGAGLGAMGTLGGDGRGAILAPLGALMGSIYGAAKAESAAAVEEAEATIKAAFASLQIPGALRNQAVQVARTETRHTVIVQDDVTRADATGESPDRAGGAMDTALEITVWGYGTRAAPTVNPLVHLFVQTRVLLLRTADNTVLYQRFLSWASPGRLLTEWAMTQGDPVRRELDRGIQYLAERIVEVVFLLRLIP